MYTPSLFDEPSGPTGPLVRVQLRIAYDGTHFRGLAPNPGVRTVVGELVSVLTPLLGYPPDIVMSGRTDAGVHAWGQMLSFDAPEGTDLDRVQRSINKRLGPEIVARSCVVGPADFSARFDATGRSYRYDVYNSEVPSPFMASTSWWVPTPLNLGSMRLACDPLIGEHDFSSFCRRPKTAPGEPALSLVRRVTSARWDRVGEDVLRFEIHGNAFCHQMVRSIVGFHVAVGRDKRTAGELRSVLAAQDRNLAENPAPPHGLTLFDVSY
ncbi:MAG: tRNA pseudouridine(38-40) synthase TruA [Acidimicrobiales bacterium]